MDPAVTPRCPRCGSTATVPIVYGLPSGQLMEASRRGEVSIGGCLVHHGQPTRACSACHASFVGPLGDDAGVEED